MNTLKNERICGTISEERKELLNEAFGLFCKLSDDQLMNIIKTIKEDENNA